MQQEPQEAQKPQSTDKLELIITFTDSKGQEKSIDWFLMSRVQRREIKKKSLKLWEKINNEAKQMLKEQKEGNSEKV